jgi:subtilisin family serine protease
MMPRPFARSPGLPKNGGNTLSEDVDFAPEMTAAPPLATDILLQFSHGADAAQVNAALHAVNGRLAEVVRAGDAEAGPLLRVELPEGQGLQDAVDVLSGQPGVVFAEANQFVSIASDEAATDMSGMALDDIQIEAVSNDTGYLDGKLWNMQGDQTAIKNQYGSQAGEAWTAGFTGAMSNVIGVVDSGIDYTHIDLYLNIWLNQGEIPGAFRASLSDIDSDGLITFRDLNNAANSAYVTDKNGNGRIDAGDLLKDTRWADGSDRDGNGYIDDLIGWDFVNNDNDPFDDNGHGTHVAGTIGAMGGNGLGVAGVNWNVQMVAIKFLSASGSGNTAGAIKSIDYFTAEAKMAAVGESFIATNNSWGGGAYSQALMDAITRSAQADILFVAAAGNNGTNNDTTANYPSNYDARATAGYDNVIAVASITSTGAISSFSDYGKVQVDLGAPGSSIYSTLPGDAYGTLSGTSMATPLVTGAAALYASTHANATAAEIKAAILGSVAATTSLSGLVATNGRLDVGTLMAGNAPPPPVAPTKIVTITAVLDNVGASQGIILAGGTTDDTTPTLRGSLSGALSAGEMLVVYHNGVKAGIATVNGTDWSFTETARVAAAWSFTARVESDTGAAGSYSAAYNITIDLGPNYIFGTVGNDSRAGSAGRDIISGLPASGTYLGQGSIDKLSGGGGNDIFLLGDSRGAFYDNGLSKNAGTSDYVQVRDFQAGDLIQLSSQAGSYFGAKVSLGGVSGLGIYVDTNDNQRFDSTDELIGQLVGVTSLKTTDILWA